MNPIRLFAGKGATPSPYVNVGADCVLYHAYWDGTAIDHSTHGNNGTPVGSPVFVPTGLSVDGSNTQYVDIPDAASLRLTTRLSAHIWYKQTVYLDYDQRLFGKGATDEYMLTIYGGGNLLRLAGSNVCGSPISPASFPLDEWHLCSVSYEQGVSSKMYKNGQDVTTGPDTTKAGTGGSGVDLMIGRDATRFWNPLTAILGEVLIFNTAKIDADILAYFAATKGRYGL